MENNCSVCGIENENDAEVCVNCGAALGDLTQEPEPMQKIDPERDDLEVLEK